jgi:acetyltransferase-like isoleucine patch superfamily enzyme
LLGFHHENPARTVLNLASGSRLVIAGTVQAWRGCQIMVLGGRLAFGDRIMLNEGSRITCYLDIQIGSRTAVSWGTNIMDSDVHPTCIDGRPVEPHAPVIIGEHVLIGAGATVLKGVHVHDGAVVGAGAVVTKDVPGRSAVAGNPARVIRGGIDWS